jgi:hypothetical protein
MAKNTKQIALMQQKRGKLNELPKELDDAVFGLAWDANRVFIGNLKSGSLQERYSSNTFPYGNLEILTEFSPLTDLIKYSPNMNGEKLYYIFEIIGTREFSEIENSKIKINDVEIEFTEREELISKINNAFENIEAFSINSKLGLRTTVDELVLEDVIEGSLDRIGLSPNTYTQTPLTKRTLQDVLDDRYSIKDFDVYGDGIQDDSEKINEAIKILSIFEKFDKKQLFFPANTYLVNDTIMLMNKTYLKGEGIDRTIVKTTADKPLLDYNTDANDIIIEGFTFDISESNTLSLFALKSRFNNIKFKDCKFIGRSGNNTRIIGSHGYSFGTSSNLVFEDCIFSGNNTSMGIYARGLINGFLITNCLFENIYTPIDLDGTSSDYLQNGIIANNKFINCGIGSNHTLVNLGLNTKYVSVIKSLVDENYYDDENYQVMNRRIDADGRYIDNNYCDTPIKSMDTNKYLRFNFYQSVYDYVQELYNKFGRTAIAVISPETDEEILNYFQLKQGTDSEDLTIEAINQVKDVYFNLGEFADLHLGKDSEIVDLWKENHIYNVLEKVMYEGVPYRCIEEHTSSDSFDSTKWTTNIDIVDWNSGYSYILNEWTYYNNKIYRCIEAHTSQTEFDDTKWEEIKDKYSKIVLHKQLDLNSNSITSSSGNIVLQPNDDGIVEINDDNYADKIAMFDSAVPSVGYVHKVLNPKNRIVLDSNTIDQIVSNSDEVEVDLFDFDRADFGNKINLKNVSVNIRQVFVPISEQIMSLDPEISSMLDWDNKITDTSSSDPDDYYSVKWYLGDVVKTTFNDTLKLFVCTKEHYASVISDSKEECFNDDLFKGYWKQLLLDVTNKVSIIETSGYDYTFINLADYPDITFIDYIGKGQQPSLPDIKQYIDTVPDVKYLSISSTDENQTKKWLFELDDVNIHKRNNGGFTYPYWEANYTYNNGDIVRFNYADYMCIATDDNNNPIQYTSGDNQLDLHNDEVWKKLNLSGYDYQINFEKSLLEMNEQGKMTEEDYVLSHNFAGCKFKLGLFDKDNKKVVLQAKDSSIMEDYIEEHNWTLNTTYYKGQYIRNNNLYVVNESFTSSNEYSDFNYDINNNIITEVEQKTWENAKNYFVNQYITNGSGDNLKYYKVLEDFTASDNIENDIANGYLEYIPSKYLQIGPSGQIIITVNYDRG